ncbi:Uncharacterised protein [Nocardia africana]|uniref:Uncharacterized protein n=1 Tax=Nocardia africana TaxID=134964 RepID=A0A378WIN2_9NOCA|nr:Uncharacterised protein [Nocardia africana]
MADRAAPEGMLGVAPTQPADAAAMVDSPGAAVGPEEAQSQWVATPWAATVETAATVVTGYPLAEPGESPGPSDAEKTRKHEERLRTISQPPT